MKNKVQGDGDAAYLFTGNSLGEYSLQQTLLKYARDACGSAGVLGVAASFDLKWRLNLSLEKMPDPSGLGSTVEFDGQARAGNTQTGLGGSSSLQGTLHHPKSCGGFGAGSRKYVSGGSTKTITYTGCNFSQ
jgi:hypothetical protein